MNVRLLCFIFSSILSVGLMPTTAYGQASRSLDQVIRTVPALRQSVAAPTPVRVDQDTTFPPALLNLPCGSSLDSLAAYFLSPTQDNPDLWGAVTGPNFYGDKEVAIRYETSGIQGLQIVQVWGFFAGVVPVNDGNLQFHLYDVASDNAPDQRLASSEAVALSSIFSGNFNYLNLTNPLVVNQPELMVSLDFSALYASNDTMSLVSTQFGCASDPNISYLRLSNDNWVSFSAPGNQGGWAAPLEVLMGYVFETPVTSVVAPDAYLRQGHWTLFPPVQKAGQLRLGWQSQRTAPYRLAIIDLQGRVVWQQQGQTQAQAEQRETISVANWAKGMYTLVATSENSRLMLKFAVR